MHHLRTTNAAEAMLPRWKRVEMKARMSSLGIVLPLLSVLFCSGNLIVVSNTTTTTLLIGQP